FIMSVSPNFYLNCLLFGRGRDGIVQVHIKRTSTVILLKQIIQTMYPAIRDADPADLQLWKVSLPFNDTFEHNIRHLALDSVPPLTVWDKLCKIFIDLREEDHLHIVIK
ncbi:uncharacterized protein EDB91DRAFT_1040168, partial [Suillus paluster]|uniref:uncharacterized protein n=1 Tax=Suillus paluster TaxID=48578 RepID=UPI001B8624D1